MPRLTRRSALRSITRRSCPALTLALLAGCGAGFDDGGAPPPPFSGAAGAPGLGAAGAAPSAPGTPGFDANPGMVVGGGGASSNVSAPGSTPVGSAGAPSATDGTAAGAGGDTSAAGAGGAPGAGGDPGAAGAGAVDGTAGNGAAGDGAAGDDAAGNGAAGNGAAGNGAAGNGGFVDVPPGNGQCPAGALFCEDFESYAAGALPNNAPWSPQTGGGATLAIDASVAQGQRALRIDAPGNSFGYIRVNGFAPPGNSFFGRVKIRVDQFPVRPDFAHWVIVEATGQGGGLVRPVGGQYIPGQGTTSLWGAGNDQGSSGDWTSWQPSAPTVDDTWICYEWQMRAEDNNIDAWIDEQPRPELSVSSTQRRDFNGARFQFPTFNTIWFGWWLFQANNDTRTVWLDDLALATTRIGCGD